MKIVTIVGARPQFVKAGAVSRAVQKLNRRHAPSRQIQERWVHTGQHYDYLMDRVFFEELELPRPDHHLGVGSGSHGKQTALMLERIEAVLLQEKPDAVMVYGDTNSTLAGALTATKLNLPVIHIESGLRSYNRVMPEEINRLLTDHLSDFLFCPTRESVQNLRKEGIKNGKEKVVIRAGDVMYDSILYYSELAEKKSTLLMRLGLIPDQKTPNAERRTPNYYLATLHRAENTDDPEKLRSILSALSEIGKKVEVVLPLHPRTRKMIEIHGLRPEEAGIRLIEPVSYLDMIALSKHARSVLTDSGGVQKEAYWLKVPCITLREETEWVETVKSGWNVLAGADRVRILKAVRRWERRRPPGHRATDLFGDGKASEKIVRVLFDHFD